MNSDQTLLENDHDMISFLDERMIICTHRGALRDWLCPSHCQAEKVLWQECIPDELFKRYGKREITMLLMQPKLNQIVDLIRSSEKPSLISLCLEGKINGKTVLMHKPHRSVFYTTPRMKLHDERLVKLHDNIKNPDSETLPDILIDIFEKNLNVDFPNLSKGNVIELLAAKIYFEL